MKEQDSFILDIKRLGINGEGIGFYKKLAVFVDNAIPGEGHNVRVTKVLNKMAFAETFEIKHSSPDRIEITCPYYKECGGCNVSHIKYNKMLELKRGLIVETLNRYTSINARQFEFVWTSMNVDSNVTKTFNVEINNVCDLWEALGAEHTLEQNDGVWVPSNASMKAIALMISEYDPSVKTRMTSKLVDVSANKSGITNVNFAEDLDNPELEGLNTTLIDNTRWGEQQDYSHLSDESHIPSLSQVISAVAFNGKNIKLV